MTATKLTDKQVMNNIFKDLRKAGFIARQNYACCQNCGWSNIGEEYNADDDSSIVFYHAQDAESFDKKTKNLTKTLFVAWQGDGFKIKEIVEQHGMDVEWDETDGMRIGIKKRD